MSTTSFPTAFESKAQTKNKVLFLWVMLLAPCCFAAPLTLSTVFSENMVLQRDQAVPVWGTAGSGLQVTVAFAGQVKTTTADSEGRWRVDLDALSASGTAQTFTVSSNGETIEYTNVLVGEVWLCSGQSNMEWELSDTTGADRPLIRMYETPKVSSASPQETVNAAWNVCTPAVAGSFSAVAYYFGVKLQEELGVPIGLLQSAWGGTRIEPWTPRIGFESVNFDGVDSILAEIDALTAQNVTRQSPTALYNAMIHPHIPFAMRGVIWYQGEANVDEGMLYRDKTEAHVNGWRALWGYDFPYYLVQLAPYDYGAHGPTVLPELWEAQSAVVETISNTGMAVISDVGNPNNIHPADKQTPGTRLALLALDNTYGQEIVSTGPVFQSMVINGDTIEVYFDSAVGLTTSDGLAPDWFEIAEDYGTFTPAVAAIVNEHVVLSSPTVASPVAMRFAWNEVAMPNLRNGAGLVASAFRAGEVKPPLFTVDPINETFAFENTAYSSSIADDVSNPDGGPMTFSKESGPAWLTVAADGSLSGTPGAGDIGANVFTVQVNVTGGSDTATLNITVLPEGATVVYHDTFDNDGLATNAGTGGGLEAVSFLDNGGAGSGVNWDDNGDLFRGSGTAGDRAVVSSLNAFNLSGGFTLTVKWTGTDSQFGDSFGLSHVKWTTDAPSLSLKAQDPFGYGGIGGHRDSDSVAAQYAYYGIGLAYATTGDISDPYDKGLIFNDASGIAGETGGQRQQLSNPAIPTSGSNTFVLTVGTDDQYSYSINGAAPTTGEIVAGAGAFDLSQPFYFNAYSQNGATTITEVMVELTSGSTNNAPSFTSETINEIDATEDSAYSSTIADDASDPESDPMTFSKLSGPVWLQVDPVTGALSGTPGDSNVGPNVFTVQVSATGGADTATLNIEVANVYSGVRGIEDLAGLAGEWLSSGCSDTPACGGADLDGDTNVTLSDLAIVAQNWMMP